MCRGVLLRAPSVADMPPIELEGEAHPYDSFWSLIGEDALAEWQAISGHWTRDKPSAEPPIA